MAPERNVTHGDDGRGYWERHARGYDLSLRPLGRPLPRMLDLVRGAVAGSERVLEVGAGTGLVTRILAGAAREVVATDYAAAMLRTLEGKVREWGLANVRCEKADLLALPFAAGSFDAVVAANVLHLVADVPAALRAVRSVLRPGGRVIAPTFVHDQTKLSAALSRLLSLTGFPVRHRFTTEGLCVTLERGGLAVTRAETLPGLIPVAYVEGVFRPS